MQMPPWANPYLILAMVVSFGMHFVILYVDVLADMFNVCPLDWDEWMLVLAFSLDACGFTFFTYSISTAAKQIDF